MVAPDFGNYSLALIHAGVIVHSSRGRGIMPLISCLTECRPLYRDCTLHDKVIGLAAAKLAAYSGIVNSIFTEVASKASADFLLEARGIALTAGEITANILTSDGSAVCPGEIIAQGVDDYESLVDQLLKMLQGQNTF